MLQRPLALRINPARGRIDGGFAIGVNDHVNSLALESVG